MSDDVEIVSFGFHRAPARQEYMGASWSSESAPFFVENLPDPAEFFPDCEGLLNGVLMACLFQDRWLVAWRHRPPPRRTPVTFVAAIPRERLWELLPPLAAKLRRMSEEEAEKLFEFPLAPDATRALGRKALDLIAGLFDARTSSPTAKPAFEHPARIASADELGAVAAAFAQFFLSGAALAVFTASPSAQDLSAFPSPPWKLLLAPGAPPEAGRSFAPWPRERPLHGDSLAALEKADAAKLDRFLANWPGRPARTPAGPAAQPAVAIKTPAPPAPSAPVPPPSIASRLAPPSPPLPYPAPAPPAAKAPPATAAARSAPQDPSGMNEQEWAQALSQLAQTGDRARLRRYADAFENARVGARFLDLCLLEAPRGESEVTERFLRDFLGLGPKQVQELLRLQFGSGQG